MVNNKNNNHNNNSKRKGNKILKTLSRIDSKQAAQILTHQTTNRTKKNNKL